MLDHLVAQLSVSRLDSMEAFDLIELPLCVLFGSSYRLACVSEFRHKPGTIAVQNRDFVIFSNQSLVRLTQLRLQLLNLEFMPARFSLPLLFCREAIVLQSVARMLMFFLQRPAMGFVFRQSLGQAIGFLFCQLAGGSFSRQRFLCADQSSLVLPACRFDSGNVFVQAGVLGFDGLHSGLLFHRLGFNDVGPRSVPFVRFLLNPGSKPLNQISQGLAERSAFLFPNAIFRFQLAQVLVNGGF